MNSVVDNTSTNLNGSPMNIYRNADGKCALKSGFIEVILTDLEAQRIGSKFATAMSVQTGVFPNTMYGCGLYDNDEDPKTVVAIISVGQINSENFIVMVWADSDSQRTRMYGVRRHQIQRWVNACYNTTEEEIDDMGNTRLLSEIPDDIMRQVIGLTGTYQNDQFNVPENLKEWIDTIEYIPSQPEDDDYIPGKVTARVVFRNGSYTTVLADHPSIIRETKKDYTTKRRLVSFHIITE